MMKHVRRNYTEPPDVMLERKFANLAVDAVLLKFEELVFIDNP